MEYPIWLPSIFHLKCHLLRMGIIPIFTPSVSTNFELIPHHHWPNPLQSNPSKLANHDTFYSVDAPPAQRSREIKFFGKVLPSRQSSSGAKWWWWQKNSFYMLHNSDHDSDDDVADMNCIQVTHRLSTWHDSNDDTKFLSLNPRSILTRVSTASASVSHSIKTASGAAKRTTQRKLAKV